MTAREALVLGLILGATRDGLEVLGYTRTVAEEGALYIGTAAPGRVVVVTVREITTDAEGAT